MFLTLIIHLMFILLISHKFWILMLCYPNRQSITPLKGFEISEYFIKCNEIGFSSPLVVFVGYTIPHPSENKMHLRVETKQVQAVQALKEALQQLQALSEHVLSTFEVKMVSNSVHLSNTHHQILHAGNDVLILKTLSILRSQGAMKEYRSKETT